MRFDPRCRYYNSNDIRFPRSWQEVKCSRRDRGKKSHDQAYEVIDVVKDLGHPVPVPPIRSVRKNTGVGKGYV